MSDTEFQLPRKLLITGADVAGRNRLNVEQERMRQNFPQFAWYSPSGRIVLKGELQTNAAYRYEIRVDLPTDYPHRLPRVFPEGWTVANRCEHKYVDGALCIMRPDQWRNYYSIAFVVAKAAIWLNKYDVFNQRGYWPGAEQSH